jgi:hypothetical protein
MEKNTLFSGLGLNQGVVRVFFGVLLRDSEKNSKKSFYILLTGLLQMNSTNRAYEKAINCQLSTTRTFECMRHDDIDFWQKPQENRTSADF